MTASLSGAIMWGNFYAGDPVLPGAATATFLTRQDQIGARAFDYASAFISFDTPVKARADLKQWADGGTAILLAWEPRMVAGMTLADIAQGRYDDHITSWLTYLRSLNVEVVIRFGHEFNGDWSPWNPSYAGSGSSHAASPADFITAWRYMVKRAWSLGAMNVRWLWCANRSDWGGYPMEKFWPAVGGTSYVHYIGYDSYCGMSRWSTPLDTVLGVNPGTPSAYQRVTALHPRAPVFIAEMGCVDAHDPLNVVDVAAGHSKADWYTELFSLDPGLAPRLTALSFFDATGSRHWRHDTSPEAFAAFRAGFTS